MENKDKKNTPVEWYDNPNIITSLIIGLIAIIVILSQSFAINNNLSVMDLLGSILNHNIFYLVICIYFVALKFKVGKKYFDFLNIFLIVLYVIRSLASLLTVFQSFGLGTLLRCMIDFLILIYIVHTVLRSTRIWQSMQLGKSPFNEIGNNGYFSAILVLSIVLLAVNLISTTSLDGTILTLLDAIFTIFFIRYIFLYGKFLDEKKISINNEGNFDEYREKIKDNIDDFVEKNNLDEAVDAITDFANDVKDKVIDLKDDIVEKVNDSQIDEKLDEVHDKVTKKIVDVKEAIISDDEKPRKKTTKKGSK